VIKKNNVTKIRKISTNKMEQQELAKRLNISVWHLNKIENHKKPLTLTLAMNIAEIFNVTLNDIFFED